MAQQTIWQQIRSRYYAMTEGERRMADLILEQREDFLYLSTSEIAARAGGSKSSVIRFCQSLGYDGLVSLRNAIRLQSEKDNASNFTPYTSRTRDHKREAETYFEAVQRVISETQMQLDIAQLSHVAEMIHSARRIYVYACGTLVGGLGEFFADYLNVLGYTAFCYRENFSVRASSASLGKGDLVIAVSFRGRTMAVVDGVNAACKAGAKTVGITCETDGKLNRLCDECVVVKTKESLYPVEARVSNYAISIVLDLLYVFLTSDDKEDSGRRLKRLNAFFEKERYPRRACQDSEGEN